MEVRFSKYHGLGNDYLVVEPNVFGDGPNKEQIRRICDRHSGIGADGILYGPIRQGNKLTVRIFNADGSEAEKSGNGLRIFAKYLFDKRYVTDRRFAIETIGGRVEAEIRDDSASLVKIAMGKVTFDSEKIPVTGPKREVVNEELRLGQEKYKMTCVSVGNPHCIILMDKISEREARRLGPLVENHQLFPNRINMQLLKVLDRANIQIEIWERGAGYTLASGSSSCAAAAVANRLSLAGDQVMVKMPGGELCVEVGQEQEVYLAGPAEFVFEGVFSDDLLAGLEI